jgi:hypothetical protein
VIQVTALSFLLTAIFDWAAARASRSTLGVDVSKTLGGTLAIRAAAWWIAWMLVHPHRERPTDRPRLRA